MVDKQQLKRGYGNMTHVLRIPNFVSCRSVLNGSKGRVLIMTLASLSFKYRNYRR